MKYNPLISAVVDILERLPIAAVRRIHRAALRELERADRKERGSE